MASLDSLGDFKAIKQNLQSLLSEMEQLKLQMDRLLEPNDELKRNRIDLYQQKLQIEQRLKFVTSFEERQRSHIRHLDMVRAKWDREE